MSATTKIRAQRMRQTKAQLLDEIERLEQRATAVEAANGSGVTARDRKLGNQIVAEFDGILSENPNPVLSVLPDGTVLYANAAARRVKGLLRGRKKSTLAPGLAKIVTGASGKAEAREREFESANRVFAFSITPIAGQAQINIYGRDITAERQAQREHRSAENLLRDAIGIMFDTFAIFDTEGYLVHCNKSFREIYEYSEAETEPGVATYDGLGTTDAAHGTLGYQPMSFAQRLSEARRHKSAVTTQYVGDRILERHQSATSEGGIISIATDITERKRVEQELVEKEAQLRFALDNMPGGMMLCDQGLNYVLHNAQYSELYEFPDRLVQIGGNLRDEMYFQADRGDFGPGDKDELIKQVVATYQRGDPVSYEREIAGAGKTLHVRLAPTPGGGSATIVTDITERKRAEEALAEKESHLRVALENMPGGIAFGDKDRNYVFINSQYSQLHDYPDDLLKVGGPMLDEARFQAERGDYGPGDTEELIKGIFTTYSLKDNLNYERTIANGRTLHFNVASTPEGGYITVATDITERKQVEEALLEAKQRSEEASELVAERNRMLESLSNQLSKYLSPQVYASIFSGEQSVEIASKRKKLTVFFSDIADFTGTTDSLESEELTNLLNHYLTEMSKIAMQHGATIDKYVGDSIIAFFGDPETRGVKEDARTCVKMAIAMQRRMRELQSEWLDMGLEQPFRQRIGINTGFCTVGNFGSADRMDYTIIGNEVNLAARLEALSKVGGILLAHETYSLVKDSVMAEEGDTLNVKGFAKPVRTYSVVGLYDDLAAQGTIIRNERGGVRVLVDLKTGDKADAIEAVKEVLSQLEDGADPEPSI